MKNVRKFSLNQKKKINIKTVFHKAATEYNNQIHSTIKVKPIDAIKLTMQ